MTRLPTVGGDNGAWGAVLNEFLSAEHGSDGTHGLGTGLVTDVVRTVDDATATYTIPAPTTAGIYDLTLSVSCTFTFPTAVPGQSFTLILRQGVGGSKLATWPDSVKWDGGTDPTLSTAAAAVDIFGFFCVGSSWFGFVSGQDMK